VHDEEAEAIYPSTRLGKVSLETKQGQQYSAKVFYPKGSPENPLSENELREKFLGPREWCSPAAVPNNF
jgi:2-methylcitrate dehydratase PrpD